MCLWNECIDDEERMNKNNCKHKIMNKFKYLIKINREMRIVKRKFIM
jgi:hypothetical protein